MAEENDAPGASITGNMLFYKKPELLNIQTHKNLGISPLTEQPFAFLRETQLVPLTVAEFGHAAMTYPIVFAGEEKSPAAVMGMKQNQNAFIDEEGKIADGIYLPAFVRRYPFASAKNSEDENNVMVCIDRASDMVTENAEAPFFEGDQLSENTKQAVDFVKAFEAETIGTANFVRMMDELGMFETQDVLISAPDQEGNMSEQKMGSFMGLSEEKLNSLSDDQLRQLRDNGGLMAFYAHRLSLANWQRLFNIEMALDFKEQQAAGQA